MQKINYVWKVASAVKAYKLVSAISAVYSTLAMMAYCYHRDVNNKFHTDASACMNSRNKRQPLQLILGRAEEQEN